MPEEGTQETGFQKKVWGLPTWGWVAIAAAGGVVVWVWWRARKASASAPDQTATGAPTAADSAGLATDQYEALLAQLRDIQGNVSQPSTSTSSTTGQQFAKRIDQPGNSDVISITALSPSWELILNTHYSNLPPGGHGTMAWMLAHESGLQPPSGSTNPMGKKILLPAYLPWPTPVATANTT